VNSELQRIQRHLIQLALAHKISWETYLEADRYWTAIFSGEDPEA
jgi:hypothetical protein